MRKIELTAKGVTPLLMHAFPLVAIEAFEKKSPEEQAAYTAYRNGNGELYIPDVAFQRGLVSAGSYSKGKGRGNLSRVVAACVFVSPPHLVITPQKYVIDTRPVVVPATKGRVRRHRPRFDSWEFSATVEWDENLITEAQLRRVVDDCGSRVGLLDFRPEKRGPFGRFIVTRWQAES